MQTELGTNILTKITNDIRSKFGSKVIVESHNQLLILICPKLTTEQQAAFDAMDEIAYQNWINPHGLQYLCDYNWWNALTIPKDITIVLRDWYVDHTDNSQDSDLQFVKWLKTKYHVVDECKYYIPMSC